MCFVSLGTLCMNSEGRVEVQNYMTDLGDPLFSFALLDYGMRKLQAGFMLYPATSME